MSYADKIFKKMCTDILNSGTDTQGEKVRPMWEDGSSAYTIKKFGVVNTYDLRKEFPALTLRKTALKSAMDEILWIYQKKSNLIEDLKSSIWDSWSFPVTNNQEIVYITPTDVSNFKNKNYNIKINPIKEHKKQDIRKSKNYGNYIKISDIKNHKCLIQFLDTGNIKEISDSSYYKGNIFDNYSRSVYGIGYYGNCRNSELIEYFGDSLNRWIDIWRHICRRCSNHNKKQYYKDCFMSPNFECCEYFLNWVMKNNTRGKKYLDVLCVDKDYYGTKCYSEETCVLLFQKENTSLTLKKWYYYDNLYFFSKEDLVKYIEANTSLKFINYNSNGERIGVSSRFKKYLTEKIEKKEILEFSPQELINNKLIRFSLKDNHSIGTCYGAVIGEKFIYKDKETDQMDYVLEQLKVNPYSRRIMTNMYQFKTLHTGALDPCCYSMTYNVTKENGKLVLNAILNQRSQDILAANNWNVCQYAILLMMVAQVNDMVAGQLIHVIADAHIYDRHVDIIKELITRDEYVAPKVTLNPKIKNFYDFTTNDLIIENYITGEQVKNIPIAV